MCEGLEEALCKSKEFRSNIIFPMGNEVLSPERKVHMVPEGNGNPPQLGRREGEGGAKRM